VQEDRQVDKDNTVVFAHPPADPTQSAAPALRQGQGQGAALPERPAMRSSTGPRCFGRYDAAGVLREDSNQAA
jgi:hypothetical protein